MPAGRDSLPMYARIEADLRGDIASGRLGLGSRAPTESELSARYGVARMTVRHALDGLVAAGLLARKRGVGTFVARTKTERVSSRLLGFHEDAVAHGMRPNTRVLTQQTEALGHADGAVLSEPAATEVLRVTRLRTVDGEPIGHNEVVILPPFAEPLADLDLTGSLYDGVAEVLGMEVEGADQQIEAVGATERQAKLLEVSVGSPLLRVLRITFLANGSKLGLTRTHYRGDRYYLSLRLQRGTPDRA